MSTQFTRDFADRVINLALAARLQAALGGNATATARRLELELAGALRVDHLAYNEDLEASETMMAISLVLDWSHGQDWDPLTASQRTALSRVVTNVWLKGLIDDITARYADGSFSIRRKWWVDTSNWNCVCGGNSLVVALHAADLPMADMPREIADGSLVTALRRSLQGGCARGYFPSGAYAEGHSYFDMATLFYALGLSSLASSGVGLAAADLPLGLLRSGRWQMRGQGIARSETAVPESLYCDDAECDDLNDYDSRVRRWPPTITQEKVRMAARSSTGRSIGYA